MCVIHVLMLPESAGANDCCYYLTRSPTHPLLPSSLSILLKLVVDQTCFVTFISAVIHHRGMPRERQQPSMAAGVDFTFDDVCKKGNTLIWDLVQDDMAVSTLFCLSSSSLGEVASCSL